MPSPPVIDHDALVAPIEGDNPAGTPMEYAVEQQLVAGRKEFEETAEGRVAREPEWDKINKICDFQLRTKSKDLRLATRYVEALTKQHGIVGLRDGMKMLRRIVEECWDRVLPVPDEKDGETMAIRGEQIADSLNDPEAGFIFPHTVRKMPLVTVDDRTYSLQDKQLSDKGQGDISTEDYGRAKPINENALEDLQEAIAELGKLNEVLEKRLENDAPTLLKLEEAMEECRMFLEHVTPKPEPEADESEETVAVSGNDKAAGTERKASSREEAYRQLANIAATLERIEPHSPIPDLLRRAVELGRLPFRDLIREIIRDQGMLNEVNREFGIKEKETPPE